ncbi:MAG: hypothetical protein JWM74_5364 [Myxococcaceae bacterium]|nr:hypothetical protein [Myxococcaceae bacterium]
MQRSSFLGLVVSAASIVAVAASCGGSIAPIGEDDDAGSASDGSSSDGASDAGRDGDPAPVDGGGKDSGTGRSCDKLRKDIDALRIAATKCCPTCKSLQCQDQAKDLCCPLTVTSASSGESQKLQAAVADYFQQGCDTACPAIPCKAGGSGICDPVTERCQQ